jgi:hypothetical protein
VSSLYGCLLIARHTYVVPAERRKERRARSGGAGEVKTNLVTALAHPEDARHRAHTRPTPSRAAALDRVVEAGLLAAEDAAELFPDRRIADPAWEILRSLDPGAESFPPPPGASSPASSTTKVRSWSLELLTAEETSSFDIDPRAFPATRLPTRAILAALEELAADGWQVVQVSEDREIDEAASRNYVVAQRILLTRPIDHARRR